MAETGVLRDLSKSLTERERKDLLDKIKKSISLDEIREKSVYHKDLNQQERELLIEQEIARSSIFTRFMLWLRSIIVGKHKEDVFISMRLNKLQSEINRKNPGLTGFELRNLYPKFAEAFFRLYSLSFALIPLFRNLWERPEVFEKALFALLNERIPESKKTLTDFIDQQAMEDIYSETGRKDAIRSAVIRRIDTYVDALSAELFLEIEKNVLPFYYVKDVVLFPYFAFFRLFHFTPKPGDKTPQFKSASAVVALEFMEQMFYAVYTAIKLPDPVVFDPGFSKNMMESIEDKKENDESESAQANPISGNLPELCREIRNFSKTVPLVELIRYFRQDPYFQLIFYIPKLDLREFYRSMIRISLLPVIDEIFDDVRRNVVEKKIGELFTGQKLIPFQNYRDYLSTDFKQLGLPTFTYVRTLNVIYNFIRWYYHTYLQEIVQILSMGMLKHNRLPLNRLLASAAALEDVEEKIWVFDISLSNDEEDGKLFQRLRVSLASEPAHQRIFRGLVNQKDKTAQGLVDRGLEGFFELKKIFDEILSSPTEVVKQRLSGFYYIKGKSEALGELLRSRSDAIEKFGNLLRNISRIEKGT
ncbi:MAG: hypothetical protein E4H36_00650 [Spirochaetales bacterium]|nr:MAG: hypothetical protein E4H36_00650 [Spirochaetales bacterium]